MTRTLATCLAVLFAACSLDFGSGDQTNEGDGSMGGDNTDPPDLPGDEYEQCVLATLQQCDDEDLTPDQCTARIAAQCNGGCDPNTMDPDGSCPPPCDPSAGIPCPPPPDDCWQTVFEECLAMNFDPMDCAARADQVCAPPPCDDPNTMGCPPPCDPATGMDCPPPPDDCFTLVFEECLAAGIDPIQCIERATNFCQPCMPGDINCCADGACPPPPCDPATGEMCPCDPMTGVGCPPPPCDPATGETCPCDAAGDCPPPPDDCWQAVFDECVSLGVDPMTCAERASLWCQPPPPPCTDPGDPNCCVPDSSGMCQPQMGG